MFDLLDVEKQVADNVQGFLMYGYLKNIQPGTAAE